MKDSLTISEYRKKARISLEHQWGMNAWLIFLSMFLVGLIQAFFEGAFSINDSQHQILRFLLENLLLFAFSYALYYIALVVLFNANSVAPSIVSGDLFDVSFVLLTVIMVFVSLVVMSIIGGLFQFAAWTKFDYPELSIIQCLKYAWYLLKDRLVKYILLQLSFIGWYILGALALFIG